MNGSVNDAGAETADRNSALASHVRRAVLALLLASDGPMTAAKIAAEIGLHVTTARFHLEHLENAKLIRREVGRAGRRGRPPVTYVADPSAREQDSNQQLAQVLTEAVAGDPDGGRRRAVEAGRNWGRTFIESLDGTDGDVSAQLTRVLNRLGFEPDQHPADDGKIRLLSCPFRDIAREHPDVVCSIHLGLLQGAAARLGADSESVALAPFVEPEVCVVSVAPTE